MMFPPALDEIVYVLSTYRTLAAENGSPRVTHYSAGVKKFRDSWGR
jgi:hypothetical protein